MIVLGIDSSTDRLGVGVADEKEIIIDETLEAAQEHASRIMGLIEEVLKRSSITKERLEGIAVADGPGSFTGLRIGMAAAKGMALALNIPIVGVSTFDIMSRRLLSEYREFYLAAMVRKGEMYLCHVAQGINIRQNIAIVDQDEILRRFGTLPIGLIGREPVGWKELAGNQIPFEKMIISGGELALYGAELIIAGKAADPGTLEPLYIAPSQAEKKFGRR